MSITLLEAAKLATDPLKRGIIEIFPRVSPVLERLPFFAVNGMAYKYAQEQTLPGVAFRGINESYDESTGVINPQVEPLFVLGGISAVDRALVRTQGNSNDLRAIHDAMKAKATALEYTKAFFKGDNSANPKEFDGLQKRLTGNQVIACTAMDPLTLAKVDELIDAVQGTPDVLFMNKTIRRRINYFMRDAGQATETVSDAFGRQIHAYAGIPIAVIEQDKDGADILGFTEDGNTTSIYAVKFGAAEFVSGLQANEMVVEDLGVNRTMLETLIDWVCGMGVFHPKAAARLSGIS